MVMAPPVDDTVTLMTKCVLCGGTTAMRLSREKLKRWHSGELCQDVFPELSVYERDVLITKICVKCQKEHGI